jgi:hypothetical protein
MGMSAMIMPDSMHYNTPLFILSVVIAVVAGTAALWIGTWVRGTRATVGASMVMGVAVSGMHYTGMAAMRVSMGSMSGMSGAAAISFLVPLLVGLTIVTFVVTMVISLSPSEDEIHEDARMRDRIATQVAAQPAQPQQPQQRQQPVTPSPWMTPGASPGVSHGTQPPVSASPLPTRRPSIDAIVGRNRGPRPPAGPRQPE